MKIQARFGELKKSRPWEVALRFSFGGLTTVATALIGHAFGPVTGGLFLCFPAILPASLTLVALHKGRPDASSEAKGAAMASTGLAAFGCVVWWLAVRGSPATVLVVSTLAWCAAAFTAWCIFSADARRS